MILSMLILPLPPIVLDIFFTFNIVLSIMILLVSMFTKSTLEFSSFPTILLFSTLLRLTLNIASTRVILLHGNSGSYSAGHVIEAFGSFLIGSNFVIGTVIFIILVIINFLVITKGSGRIAEVGARFFLDSMPGKQMAVDADLNSGMITIEEAKYRRKTIEQESDFYGAMDGANKFIKGDAIAGILIMIVNIIGGLSIGILQHNMSFLQAATIYSILTIGDGLVTQIPALIISTASGVIVTRVNTNDKNIGEQMIYQIFNSPKIILLGGIVLGVFGLIPGMPNFMFLIFTCGLFLLSWRMYSSNIVQISKSENSKNLNSSKIIEASWNDVQFEYPISIELSKKLLPILHQNKKNNFLKNIQIIRKNITQNTGFLLPNVNITHNINLEDGYYRILIKGVEYARGMGYLDKLLAIDSYNTMNELSGIKIQEPVFGLPAFWINLIEKEHAIKNKFTVVDIGTVITTYINKILINNIHELLGFQEIQQLIEHISEMCPKLIDHLIPNIISITTLQKILQNLLQEKIPIRDMNTILETLINHGFSLKNNIVALTNIVRLSLKKIITQKFFYQNQYINAIGLSQSFEITLLELIKNKNNTIEPTFLEHFIIKTKNSILHPKKNKRTDCIISS
ncbi:type III protein export, membrane component [Buchnera aphidicola (Cinara tujafilina)]|uniref:Type III protein export, membrane component n=1 Tax=Buchnera aphidicola (Cinara tujafilina) TaxID=261317 RepID=F7WZ89_9GAMM|nr:type III protein export, membrane component [Buchnera aphidicola (Cinara tujafilina)]